MCCDIDCIYYVILLELSVSCVHIETVGELCAYCLEWLNVFYYDISVNF